MCHEIDEKLERMIVRFLDGEAAPAEAAELRQRLFTDPSAKLVLHEYSRIDLEARQALGSLFAGTPASATTPKRRPLGPIIRFAMAVGVMGAAAAIGFMLSPSPRTDIPARPDRARPEPSLVRSPTTPQSTLASDEALNPDETWRRMMPHRDYSEVRQDWLGVYDEQTKRVFLIGVDRRGKRTVPVIYEN